MRTVFALRKAFPGSPVRIDPNCRWTLEAAQQVAERLDGVVEYLEDPCAGLETMARLRATTRVPLATNMLAEDYASHMPVLQAGAADVVLLDHHVIGGLQRAVALAHTCHAWGLATSMHSNSHLGVSLAAMAHLAAAVGDNTHASDTHYPW